MDNTNIEIIGDYIEPEQVDFEGSLTFNIRAAYIEKRKLWKNKNLTAEFFGNFWKNILETESIKSTLHFVCAELLENAVIHSIQSDYLVMIKICFKLDELLVYVENSAAAHKIPIFQKYIRSLLEAENLQQLFILRMKEARKSGSQQSQVGLMTLMKDRGAKLSWKFEYKSDSTRITTLAKIDLKRSIQ